MENEDILTSDQAKEYVSEIHRSRDNPLGDVLKKIEKFTQYVWRDIPVFSLPAETRYPHQPLVKRYIDMIEDGEEVPPIIYDDVDDTVIDGLHRIESARQSGLAFIPAWVGLEENIRE
jgi:hypothetical protein